MNYIIFCSEISSMGKRFEDNEYGREEMSKYLRECFLKYPKATIKIQRYI